MMPKAGVEANAISYHIVFEACAVAHEVARVEYMMSLMLRDGVEVTNISHGTVIRTRAIISMADTKPVCTVMH